MSTQTMLIATELFDGPLSLLLHLVEKNNINIHDLNIHQVTAQYLEYLKQLNEFDFNEISDYLYMAAYLTHLKAKSCSKTLERDKKEKEVTDFFEEHKRELITKLQNLQHYQKMGQFLESLPERKKDYFPISIKQNEAELENTSEPSYLYSDLIQAMIGVIKKNKKKFTTIEREQNSLKKTISKMKSYLPLGSKTTFIKILTLIYPDQESKKDTILVFLSLLELARLNKVKLNQEIHSDLSVLVIDHITDNELIIEFDGEAFIQ